MAKPRRITPSRVAERFFRWMFPDGGFDTTVCDLEESFQEVVRAYKRRFEHVQASFENNAP
jgi:hypothetical protein